MPVPAAWEEEDPAAREGAWAEWAGAAALAESEAWAAGDGARAAARLGDLPNRAGRGADEVESERKQRLEMLKEYTKLDRKGDPIYLSNVLPSTNNAGTLFYFPNFEPIKPEDKQVTFVTKMGPIEVKAKFSLKEMVYHGSLAL